MYPDFARWDMNYGLLSATDIAAYADASGDHNPIHLDEDYARSSGYDTVIAHGMLGAGLLASFVLSRFPDAFITDFSVRFHGPAWRGSRLTATGVVERVRKEVGKHVCEVSFSLANGEGTITSGTATLVVGE